MERSIKSRMPHKVVMMGAHRSLPSLCLTALLTLTPSALVAQAYDAKPMLNALIEHEDLDAVQRGRYLYTSVERSDRTSGHLWTERVCETPLGKLRFLIAEDGTPLSPERVAAERGRMAQILADPAAFQKKEQAQKGDESHARQMLALLPKAFVFDAPTHEGPYLRFVFHPNPAYSPQSMEERVLVAMTGSILVEQATTRLHGIEGRLPQDVSIGFGLLATIKAGSNFSTTRDRVDGDDWKTAKLDTDINGRAIFFKTIARKQHAEHSAFRHLPDDLPFDKAIALIEAP
jgi:hypothetical protein